MEEELHNYRIKENLFQKSLLFGFSVEGADELKCEEDKVSHVFISGAVDGAKEDGRWGRLRFSYQMEDHMVMTVYAFAANDRSRETYLYGRGGDVLQKRRFFEESGALKAVNKNDMLLYGLSGRYLYLMIDIAGEGNGCIKGIQVNNRGDVYMDTLPEAYREYGSFFHRYLSIFSSLFLDLQEKISRADRLLDLDEAPARLLPVLARWMGIDVSGDFLEERRLRALVKEAYRLNKRKGTKEAFERLTEIVLDEKAVILEKNVFRDHVQIKDKAAYERLYGNGIYDVTMLIKSFVPENKKSQLMFLLDQFKPVRCRLFLCFLDGRDGLDNHVYLDMNAQIKKSEAGVLDERMEMDQMALLEE